MGDAKIKRLAALIARAIFTTSYDNKPFDTLRMSRGQGLHEDYLGALNEEAVRACVEAILKSDLADSD